MLIKLNKDTVLTEKHIIKLIELHKNEVINYNNTRKYYEGDQDIVYRTQEDPLKPNNKLAHTYASTIVDRYAGYFMGEGISYKENTGGDLEKLNLISIYNDERQHNMEVAKSMGIYGFSYELMWIDEEGQFRFKEVEPQEMIVVSDNTLNEDIMYAIHITLNKDLFGNEDTYSVSVYDNAYVKEYTVDSKMSQIAFVGEYTHNLPLVPVAVYKNNEELMGDFDKVKTLIDAYDKLGSDRLNDIETISDTYLALYGIGAIGEEYFGEDEGFSQDQAIQDMRKNKVLIFNDKDSKAEFLTKTPNGADAETLAIRLVSEIHKQSGVPEDFEKAISGATSGQALKMLMFPMENRTAVKESGFRKGLYRRLEVINGYLKLFNVSAWNAITPVFTRNIPTADMNSVDDLVKLVQANIISTETAMSQVPFIEDITKELENVKTEKEEAYDAFAPQFPAQEEEEVVE